MRVRAGGAAPFGLPWPSSASDEASRTKAAVMGDSPAADDSPAARRALSRLASRAVPLRACSTELK